MAGSSEHGNPFTHKVWDFNWLNEYKHFMVEAR
jgi:hypothetical protein